MTPIDLNTLPLPDLYAELASTGLVTRLLELARDEDVGPGDVTSVSAVRGDARGRADLVSRSGGLVAGLAAVPEILRAFGAACVFEPACGDGERIDRGQRVGSLVGPVRDILTVERTVLNVVSRLSGVATRTGEFVSAVGAGVRAKLYDTRKTTPGLRVLEKYAVRCGGGFCHRVGLFDAVLIKDNHIAGVAIDELGRAVASAAERARAAAPRGLRFVEVEVDRLEQLSAVLETQRQCAPRERVDIVLLDNMAPGVLREAVALRDRRLPRMELEASGGISLGTIRAVAETGVDRISTGSITHHAVWLDLGLDIW